MGGVTGVITLLHELASCSCYRKSICKVGFSNPNSASVAIASTGKVRESSSIPQGLWLVLCSAGGDSLGSASGVVFVRHDSASERHKNCMSGVKINSVILLLGKVALK